MLVAYNTESERNALALRLLSIFVSIYFAFRCLVLSVQRYYRAAIEWVCVVLGFTSQLS